MIGKYVLNVYQIGENFMEFSLLYQRPLIIFLISWNFYKKNSFVISHNQLPNFMVMR